MSNRRVPLANHPGLANSPLRGISALTAAAPQQGSKRCRSHADLQREEGYGEPPPAKRQMVEHAAQRVPGTPTRSRVATKFGSQRLAARPAEKASHAVGAKHSREELDRIRQWQAQIRSRFPHIVFYFESVPDAVRGRIGRHVTHLGARVEQFFSNEVTHVVTTRPIPSAPVQDENDAARMTVEQPKTIDPTLLNRMADVGMGTTSTRRMLLFDAAPAARRFPGQAQEEATKKASKPRNMDLLCRALDLKKKIWSLEKLQKILDTLESEGYAKSARHSNGTNPKAAGQSNLLQLLHNERVHGPSDRDPTVHTQELVMLKGPYIHVYDMEEKVRPIMVREYQKVVDKKDGDWPQFRVVSQGRCPFVEDQEEKEVRLREKQKQGRERVAKAKVDTCAPKTKAPEMAPPQPVTGKRRLAAMQDGHNRGSKPWQPIKSAEPSLSNARPLVKAQNAFLSNAKAPRLLAGEPMASGMQPSNVTSAIRSQMMSSTGGVFGAKNGSSKEIHRLQRKVLQKAGTPVVSQELSSRQMDSAEVSVESNPFLRSTSLGRASASSRRLLMIEEDESKQRSQIAVNRSVNQPAPVKSKQRVRKARDPKPGYCENCQDKFDDFEDHIISRKHRKFAETDDNWTELDALLGQLKRAHRCERHDPVDPDR